MTKNSIHERINKLIRHFVDKELILLESQQPSHPSSRRSYLAVQPKRSIKGYGNHIIEEELGQTKEYQLNPWQALEKFQKKGSWLFGYLGYDLKNYIEDLKSENLKLTDTPDFYFMEPEILIRIENDQQEVLLGEADFNLNGQSQPSSGRLSQLRNGIERNDYLAHVETIKKRIKEGDFYELNFSYPITGKFLGDPYWLYSEMRDINPVPFGSYIQGKDFAVSCASPERFLKKTGALVVSEPIKGTSARSNELDEDTFQKSLLLNEKNRAENLMIVDLVRHDLSQIAKPGSVTVEKLFDIQSFGTVHQLISTVKAEVDRSLNPVSIIKACFPMGSMTGAPKITVMKAIDELENYQRNIYSGAIGYIQPNGDFDFNVVIRSAILQNNNLVYPVGGAITSDSDAHEEWEETKLKARTLTEIISTERTISK